MKNISTPYNNYSESAIKLMIIIISNIDNNNRNIIININ